MKGRDLGASQLWRHYRLTANEDHTPGQLDAILRLTATTPQRPAWTFVERWLPRSSIGGPDTLDLPLRWRTLGLISLLILALAAGVSAGALFVGSQERVDREERRLPAVVGPAANGLLAYDNSGDIFVGDPATGQTTAIVTGPAIDLRPIFSPDGARIAFVRGEWLTADASIVVVEADGSDERVIVPAGFPGRGIGLFAWTPDSASIVVNHDVGIGPSGGNLSVFDASGEAAPRLLTPPLPAWPGGGHPQTSGPVTPMFRPPTGDRILSYDWDTGTLYVMDPDGSDVTELIRPSATEPQFQVISGPAWSPDAERIAFEGADESWAPNHRWQDWRIFVVNADGTGLTRLSSRADEVTPGRSVADGRLTWSPDGSRILFDRVSIDAADMWFPLTVQIMVVDVATGAEWELGAPKVVAGRQDPYPGRSWSPDGRSIVVLEQPGTRPIVIDVDTGQTTQLPWEADSPPSWQRVAID